MIIGAENKIYIQLTSLNYQNKKISRYEKVCAADAKINLRNK